MDPQTAAWVQWTFNIVLAAFGAVSTLFIARLFNQLDGAVQAHADLRRDFHNLEKTIPTEYVSRATLNDLVVERITKIDEKIDRLLELLMSHRIKEG